VVAAFAEEGITNQVLAHRDALGPALERVRERIRSDAPHLEPVHFEVCDDPEHGGARVVVRARMNGGSQETVMDAEFCQGPEFAELRRLAAGLKAAGRGPFSIVAGEKSEPAATVAQAVASILQQARRGLDIQRYKGLGEMNPEQLWVTTMNPETRTLLQVRVEDAYEADEIFSTLMGDEVEPRRRFIEDNALSVRNLDI
jgi:DNA gyrase subunit B